MRRRMGLLSRSTTPDRAAALVVLAVLVCCFGCAHHPVRMAQVRMLMAQQQYVEALGEVEKVCKSEDDVLCLLEKGLLLHYAGKYRESNDVFERAEILTEDLYTKSLSRQAVSLITSDLALEYVPKPFEQVLVNYFRALNYMFLGLKEDALVECRKASDKLARYSEEEKRPYRHDAFLEYLTGILYEWGGETNNAFISYRNALEAYRTYSEIFAIQTPPELTCDLLRTAAEMDFRDEIAAIAPEERDRCTRGAFGTDSTLAAADLAGPAPGYAKIVVFVEQGFVPAIEEWSLNIPILKPEAKAAHDDPFNFSIGIAPRMYGYSYDIGDIAYFLRVAVPHYPDEVPDRPTPTIYLDSLALTPAKCEDTFSMARKELDQDMPGIFAKTAVRALAKYKLTDAAGDKWGKILGGLLNAATAATEQADLRAWLSLPRSIYLATIYVRPGQHCLSLAVPRISPEIGSTPGSDRTAIDVGPGATVFVRLRQY